MQVNPIPLPSGATTYTISGGSFSVSPTSTTAYTITGSNAQGCAHRAISTVSVKPGPNLVVNPVSAVICTGETSILSVGGALSYTWSTAENSAEISVSPTVQTIYTVSGTNTNGCETTKTIVLDVSECAGLLKETEGSKAKVNVFPNPGHGVFVIELASAAQVTITNALGQTIFSEIMEGGKNPVTLQNQAAGIYFVSAKLANKQHVIKWIKE